MVADRRNGALALILLAGWINLKVFLFGPLTIYVTNAEEMQVGFHGLVFLYLIPFLVSGAILIVLDGFQSDVFEELVEGSDRYRENFRGFTFFREATTSTRVTHLSVSSFISVDRQQEIQPAGLGRWEAIQ